MTLKVHVSPFLSPVMFPEMRGIFTRNCPDSWKYSYHTLLYTSAFGEDVWNGLKF